MTLHDPDVVYTDLGLAVLAGYLGWRLAKTQGPNAITNRGAVILGGLASAALWGAIFHGFFPAGTSTLAGFIVWIPVSVSILIVAAVLLSLAIRIVTPSLPMPVLKSIVAAYGIAFAVVVLLVDESFSSIVRFYAPALAFFMIAATREAIRSKDVGWTLIAAGFAISAGASVLQQLKVAIDPVYFDHNAVYHVLEGITVVLLYRGFLRAETPAKGHASRPDRASRQG